MTPAAHGHEGLSRRSASRLAGVAVAALAAAALAGWWGVEPLERVGFALKPPVASGLAVLGLALAWPGRGRRLAAVAGLAVTALAVVLMPFTNAAGGGILDIPNLTMLALALAGMALAFGRFESLSFAATALVFGAAAIAVLAILSAVSGLDALDGAQLMQMPAVPAAVALILIACGVILARGRLPRLATTRPLWQLLFALGCATVAPLVLFGAYAGSRFAEAELDGLRNDLRGEARSVATEIDRQMTGEIEKLRALAASPSLARGDFAEFQRQAEAGLPEHGSGMIALIDRDMAMLLNTRVPYGTRQLQRTVIPGAVARALASGQPQFTGLFRGSLTDQFLFAIVVPVTIDGDNRYALASTPDRAQFAGFVAGRDLPLGWQVAVTDGTRRILARSGQENGAAIGSVLPPAQWHDRLGGDADTFEFVDAAGRRSLQGFARSETTGWETAVWGTEEVLTAPVRALWRTLGWLALLAFGLVAALALWFGRQIAAAVGQAARAASALGAGTPLPPGKTRIAEVNTLMAQLHEASSRREGVERLLRRSEATFRVMFDESSVPKIEVVPADGRFVRVNGAMCRFLGYGKPELLDMTVRDITFPDDRARDSELVHRALGGEIDSFDVEKRYVRKDGTPVWARTTVNIIRDDDTETVRDFAVIEDIDARKRAEHDLRTSRDRLEQALQVANLGSWQYDPGRRMLTGDARVKEIHGFDTGLGDIPIEDLFEHTHPEDVGRVGKAMAGALDPVNPRRTMLQYRVRDGAGGYRWVETLGQAYFEGEGATRHGVSVVGTSQDVTERKLREEKEQLLMREINHRAKNMLSVVSAIANQTAARNPRDFVARFSERIQALSANQDLLVRNEWNGVDVEDLVRAQLAHFVELIGTRIAVHGPKLRLTAAAAQAIGLALHELATNAGKYGALSTDRGEVDITWDSSPDGADAAFTMSWIESGGPEVVPPAHRGFGTVVIDAMAQSSVAGTVDLDYAPAGVRWRLDCPVANVLEPPERHDGGPGGSGRGGSQADAVGSDGAVAVH